LLSPWLSSPQSAEAQKVTKGTVSGTLQNAGVAVPPNGSAAVFVAPASDNFILTTLFGVGTSNRVQVTPG